MQVQDYVFESIRGRLGLKGLLVGGQRDEGGHVRAYVRVFMCV